MPLQLLHDRALNEAFVQVKALHPCGKGLTPPNSGLHIRLGRRYKGRRVLVDELQVRVVSEHDGQHFREFVT
ncbi:MAG: hypothetical protein LC808_00405 [Actinobacteria bacterium]|nr:hypothetical protein [Actinomycetota bacterium]